MKRIGCTIIAVIFAALLVAPAPAVAAEKPPHAPPRWPDVLEGEVSGINEHVLSINTPRGEVPVLVGEGTRFYVPGVVDPTLEDVEVGDRVVVLGRRGERAFRAQLVGVVDPQAELGRRAGQVTSVEGNVVTLATPSGESHAVHTDPYTIFHIPGVDEPGLEDIQVGQAAIAAGVQNEDGSLQAILLFVPQEMDLKTRLRGEVLAIEGATLTLRAPRDRELSILTDEGTTFHILGVDDPSLDDVQVGDRVAVDVQMASGAPLAQRVLVMPEHFGRLEGEVAGIEGTTLSLQTRHGVVQVLTGGSTLFLVPGVEDAGLEDVQVGDRVTCGGVWQDAGGFEALVVQVSDGSIAPGRPGRVRGQVLAVSSSSLTLGTHHGAVSVLVNEETEIHVPGVENPTLEDIEVGFQAGAEGTWDENGALVAHRLGARAPGRGPGDGGPHTPGQGPQDGIPPASGQGPQDGIPPAPKTPAGPPVVMP